MCEASWANGGRNMSEQACQAGLPAVATRLSRWLSEKRGSGLNPPSNLSQRGDEGGDAA
jgi:hypothetical protein